MYQYANYLCERGHVINVVHSLSMEPMPKADFPAPVRSIWRKVLKWRRIAFPPRVRWQQLDSKINLVYLPWNLDDARIPDADFIFATAWKTAAFVDRLPSSKGEHCYLIQHWETWNQDATDEVVGATWKLPMHKIVISRWLLEHGVALGAKDLTHIPNAIDHNRFKILTPPDHRAASVVALSHSADWKGTADALSALEMLHESHPEVSVSLFGTQPRRSTIPAWIRYFENPSQEVLVREIYNSHAIYLGASWTEGWGLPPAEAMACGCAFVGTDIGGYREYAINAETALLSEPRNPAALYRNLVRLIDDQDLLTKIQTQGTEYIRQFTWDRSGRAMEAWLSSLQGGGQAVAE